MLHVASLGSGSSGNSTVIRSDNTTLLLDCGFTLKETTARLSLLGLHPSDIDAVLLSHEHGDHVKGVGPLSRKFATPIWLTHGTYSSLRDNRFHQIKIIDAHSSWQIGDIQINPFPTPHDAAESCQYVFTHEQVRFACVTDLGACTPHVVSQLEGINSLIVETNYDATMLANGPYPYSLQQRIKSNFGHLGNEQGADLVKHLDHAGLQHILLGHLSEQNNSDQAAFDTMQSRLDGGHERIHVLAQHKPSAWFAVNKSVSLTNTAATADTGMAEPA